MKSQFSDWRRVIPVVSVIILLGCSGLRAQSIDSPPDCRQSPDGIRPENAFSFDTVRLFGDDTLYIFTTPSRWDGGDWLTFAGEAGVALGTTAFDRSICNSVQAHRSASLDRFSRNFELLG
jgi:hypothetical protein